MKKIFVLLVLTGIFGRPLGAQIAKFGKVSAKEFALAKSDQYKDEDAVVLFRDQKSELEYNATSGWWVSTTIHERILIVKKKGESYATVKIPYYSEKDIVKIKAYTYNRENGRINKYKLDPKDIYSEEDKWGISYMKKFTFPRVHPGSIIEWTVKIESPFIAIIPPVIYKSYIPIRFSQAQITVPEKFHYRFFFTPYFPRDFIEDFDGGYHYYHFQLGNQTAIREEPWVDDTDNYIGKIRIELAFIEDNRSTYYLSDTWKTVVKYLYNIWKNNLNKKDYYYKDIVPILRRNLEPRPKLDRILSLVRTKVRWNNHTGTVPDKGPVKAYKTGEGNSADMNLILISMLRNAGLKAYPVFCNTLGNGPMLFPSLSVNYMLTAVQIDSSYVLVDPTSKFAPPGVLPRRALNWEGMLVKDKTHFEKINLFPQKHSIAKHIVSAKITDEGEISGFDRQYYTGNDALYYRYEMEDKKKEEQIKYFENKYDGVTVENIRTTNLKNINKPYIITLQFNMEDAVEEIGNKQVVNPALFLGEPASPLKEDKRLFPIFFGYPYVESYEVNLQIPPSYEIDKLPEDMRIDLPQNMGTYVYHIEKKPGGIKLIVQEVINRPVIPAQNYAAIKDFFEKMWQKEQEKIVLKRK